MREAQSSVDRAGAVRAARIGGNAAGVVEWADPAFAELTGIALDELAQKPVARLLERVGIDLSVVDFVAERFFEGGLCRVELPFERPDGARLEVLLEVEPLRNASGEIDRFVATAHARPPGSTAPEPPAPVSVVNTRNPGDSATPPRATRSASNDLSQHVRRAALDFAARAQSRRPARLRDPDLYLSFDLNSNRNMDLRIDLDLAAEPLPIALEGELLEAVVALLLESSCCALAETRNAGATITLSTRRAEAGRRFVSPAHAIPSAATLRRGEPCLVLEVHDTGPMLSPDARSAPRRAALARARARLSEAGIALEYETTPGCGNQALAVFALAP